MLENWHCLKAGFKNHFWQINYKNKAMLTRLKKTNKNTQKPAKYKEKSLHFSCYNKLCKINI